MDIEVAADLFGSHSLDCVFRQEQFTFADYSRGGQSPDAVQRRLERFLNRWRFQIIRFATVFEQGVIIRMQDRSDIGLQDWMSRFLDDSFLMEVYGIIRLEDRRGGLSDIRLLREEDLRTAAEDGPSDDSDSGQTTLVSLVHERKRRRVRSMSLASVTLREPRFYPVVRVLRDFDLNTVGDVIAFGWERLIGLGRGSRAWRRDLETLECWLHAEFGVSLVSGRHESISRPRAAADLP